MHGRNRTSPAMFAATMLTDINPSRNIQIIQRTHHALSTLKTKGENQRENQRGQTKGVRLD